MSVGPTASQLRASVLARLESEGQRVVDALERDHVHEWTEPWHGTQPNGIRVRCYACTGCEASRIEPAPEHIEHASLQR